MRKPGIQCYCGPHNVHPRNLTAFGKGPKLGFTSSLHCLCTPSMAFLISHVLYRDCGGSSLSPHTERPDSCLSGLSQTSLGPDIALHCSAVWVVVGDLYSGPVHPVQSKLWSQCGAGCTASSSSSSTMATTNK